MDIWELIKNFGAPVLGALAAYFAIREDLAVIKVKIDAHRERLEKLEDWKEFQASRGNK